MSLERQPQRFLPFFPTLTEIKGGTTFISDHGAMLYEHKMEAETVRMLSLNVHAPDPKSSGFNADEKDEQVIQRGVNTVNFLLNMIDEHKLDMVMTQETYFLDAYFERIKRNDIKNLLIDGLEKRGWKIQENGDKNAPKDLMTLYNAKRLTLQTSGKDEKLVTDKLSHFARQCLKFYTQRMTFSLKDTNKPLTVNHVHWPHHDIPLDAEAILKILRDSVVIGDFNNRIVIPGKLFLVNNVVPPMFRKGKQGADYTDGVFVINDKGEVHQPSNLQVVNTLTGKIHSDEVTDFKNFTEEQIRELLKPCVFVAVAKEHRLNVEEKHVEFFEKQGLQLRQSTNALNQKGLAILFSLNNHHQHMSEFLERRLEGKLINAKTFVDSVAKEMNLVAFFPSDQLQTVMQEIQIFHKNNQVFTKAIPLVQAYFDQIDNEIKKLEDKKSEDKQLPIKKAKKTAAELLKSKIEGWIENGTAGMQNPFAHEKEMMQLADPEIVAGTRFAIFNKQLRAPRLAILFDNLVKLDKELVYVSILKTVVGELKNDVPTPKGRNSL